MRNDHADRLRKPGGGMKNQTNTSWTDEKTELLKKLWGDGLSAAKIGGELGFSRNAVISKIHRMRIQHSARKPSQLVSPLPRIASAKPPRSKFNPGPPPGGRPDHMFGKPNTIKPWNPPALTSDQKEYILGQSKLLLDFDDLPTRPKYCRWPINEPKRDEFYLFCAGATPTPAERARYKIPEGCPYCLGHWRISVGSGTPSERRATEAA